jgi:hypothetical protein
MYRLMLTLSLFVLSLAAVSGQDKPETWEDKKATDLG